MLQKFKDWLFNASFFLMYFTEMIGLLAVVFFGCIFFSRHV